MRGVKGGCGVGMIGGREGCLVEWAGGKKGFLMIWDRDRRGVSRALSLLDCRARYITHEPTTR